MGQVVPQYSELTSQFLVFAMGSLLMVLPFILQSVLIWMTNYRIIPLQISHRSERPQSLPWVLEILSPNLTLGSG